MKYIIYKVINKLNNDIIYIGSTKQKYLSQRKGDHCKPSNNSNLYLHEFVYLNGGWDNFLFDKIIENETDDDKERFIKEREYIELYNPYCNKKIPYRSNNEKIEIRLQYIKNNKDNINEYYKYYNDINKEKIKEQTKKRDIIRCHTFIDCECGGRYSLTCKSNHINTELHKKYLETGKKEKRTILCFKDNELIKEYNNTVEINNELNIKTTALCNNLYNRSKTCSGYKFVYKIEYT